MKNVRFVAVALGLGLAMVPLSVAAQDVARPEKTATAIPDDQQATKEQVAKLFEVMRLKQQVESMQKMMPGMIRQQMQAQSKEIMAKMPGESFTPEQQEAMNKVTSVMLEKAITVYSADEMIADMTSVYQRHITRPDADALIAFYGSPVGQRLLDAQPAIAREYMPIVMGHEQDRMKMLMEDMMKQIQEIKKPTGAVAPKGK